VHFQAIVGPQLVVDVVQVIGQGARLVWRLFASSGEFFPEVSSLRICTSCSESAATGHQPLHPRDWANRHNGRFALRSFVPTFQPRSELKPSYLAGSNPLISQAPFWATIAPKVIFSFGERSFRVIGV